MRRFCLFVLTLYLITSPVFAQQEIQLTPLKRSSLLITKEGPVVYKPTRLVTGQETKFKIKADPGSYASLATSYSNSGAPMFYGQKLRLGTDIKTLEGIVPDSGLLELNIEIPDNKDLENKPVYFEVAVWKNKDFSDLKIAKIMDPSGRETNSNEVLIKLPPENTSLPGFSPVLPGAELRPFMDSIEKIKNNEPVNPFEDREDD